MKTNSLKASACLAVLMAATLPVSSQLVRIQFTAEVIQSTGALLDGVSVGSQITGQVEIDLAYLPPDSEPGSERAYFNYSGMGLPGYVFEFSTGGNTLTFDSIHAATGLGISPGISLVEADDTDVFDLAARDEGDPYGVLLQFWDFTEPFSILTGDYFPEDVNLAGGVDRALFTYSDFLNPEVVVARLTSSSMGVEWPTPTALLAYRVRVSVPGHHQNGLLALLKNADVAYDAGRCEVALKHLAHFQHRVRSLIETDPVLASHLLGGAQELIDFGCP